VHGKNENCFQAKVNIALQLRLALVIVRITLYGPDPMAAGLKGIAGTTASNWNGARLMIPSPVNRDPLTQYAVLGKAMDSHTWDLFSTC
jgi:hypothetical protein